MEKIILDTDVKVFGIEVTTFPTGIGEAFDELIKKTGDAAGARDYYGVSSMNTDGKMIYKALAKEKYSGEAKKYNYEESAIEKGEYLYTTLRDWRSNTNCIKDIFYEMIKGNRVDKTKPAVEWYKNDEEMLCMVRTLS